MKPGIVANLFVEIHAKNSISKVHLGLASELNSPIKIALIRGENFPCLGNMPNLSLFSGCAKPRASCAQSYLGVLILNLRGRQEADGFAFEENLKYQVSKEQP
jgi:hypothetical protein